MQSQPQNINSIKYGILKRFFGHDSFRNGQEQLIDNILSGRDVLGVMPTGAGKSVCYQIPALMLEGITIVISPLISLMKDQVNSLIQAGISSAYLNSSLTQQQYETALSRAKQGAYKIIYVAPERLDTPAFRSFSESVKISMIAVDEAHCVSQWGQDFRPSYLNIRDFFEALPQRPIICAFTATATDAVKKDIVKMLDLKDPFTITTGFDRKNLYFAVSEPKDKLAETERLVRAAGEMSGIIYCSTRKNTELVCDYLNQHGLPCTRYHAGLTDEERRKNQDDFLYDRVRLMSATNAFGMGIDKSNVSFVIHYNMPKNLESYYQEAGRAGRDGSEASCTLLFSRQDVRTCRFLIDNSNENAGLDDETAERLKKRDLKRLNDMVKYCTTADCLRSYILNYFGEKSSDMCAKCSNCAVGFVTEDVTLAAQKILSCVYRLSERNLRMSLPVVADILHGSKNKRIRDFNLQELSTYGIMSDTPIIKIRAIGEGLCDRGYMRRGDYEALILTNKARELLFDGETLSMPFKKSTAESKPKAASSRSYGGKGVVEENPELFEKLRELRSKLAEKNHVPAYIIFSDASLHDMCRRLPKDRTEFLYVAGVGEVKAERFGEMFTEEIRKFISENADIKKSEPTTDMERRRRSQQSYSAEEYDGNFGAVLKASSKPLKLHELAQAAAKKTGESAEDMQEKILSFLLLGGYLREDNGELAVTPKGGINGIAMSTKCSTDGSGKRETAIEYKASAQRMIISELIK